MCANDALNRVYYGVLRMMTLKPHMPVLMIDLMVQRGSVDGREFWG